MKNIIILLSLLLISNAAFAHKAHMPGRPPVMAAPHAIHHPRPMPPPIHRHHPHHGNFWAGVGVGLAGSLLLPPVPPLPVVSSPVVYAAPPPRIWVPPTYGERPIYRSGIYVGTERYIITPGYWR